MDVLHGWKPDFPTVILTVVLLPLALFLMKITLKYLKRWTGYLLEGAMYWFSRIIMHSLAGSLTLRRYCRLQLAEGNQYMHVPSSLDIKLDIDGVYVTLTLERQGGLKGTYTHTDLLKAGNRIRVIGDPGSGKSSLTKRLFRDACHKAVENPRKSQLPIFIELKNLDIPSEIEDEEMGVWLIARLRDNTEKSAVYQMADCFDSYAQSVGLLVLLDGLDEVSTRDYPRMQRAIRGLSDALAHLSDHNNIVLTMRTQFHQQIKDDYRDTFALAMFLKPFSPTDIYEFLTRWPFRTGAEQHIPRIYKDLTDRPTLREMCSNPLVLSMYVADDQAAGHIMAPETRTEFYSKVTEELLIRRRLQQKGPTVAATKLREQRERVLGRLAYQHLLDPSQPTNSLDWGEAILVVAEIVGCNNSEAEMVFREMAKETGLVTEERASQTFRFIHLTFCEFLAAFEAVQGQKKGWDKLVEAHKSLQSEAQLRSRLTEVIPFACGLLPRIERYDAITDIAELRDTHLLALSFLETKLYDHRNWQEFARSEEQLLLNTPEEEWDEQWLRRLHLFNVVVRDANQSAMHISSAEKPPELSVFFKTLVASQESSLSTLLSAYAAQDAAAAFRLAEICNLDLAGDFPEVIVSNCDQPPFFALIRSQALQELNRIELWASVLTEAGLRSKVVAAALMDLPPEPSLDRFVNRVPKEWRWFSKSTVGIDETFYTQIVTIAVSSGAGNIQLPRLDLLRTLPPPGSQVLGRSIVKFGWFVLTAITVGLVFLRTREMGFYSRLFLVEACLVFGIFATMRFTLRSRQLHLGYLALLQVKRFRTHQALSEHDTQSAGRFLRLLLSRRSEEDFLGKRHRPTVDALLLESSSVNSDASGTSGIE